MWRS
jgi:hypothetical protein